MAGCGDGPSPERANTCSSAMRHASGSIGEHGPRSLEVADEEGVDGHQVAGVLGLDGEFAHRVIASARPAPTIECFVGSPSS